MAITKQKKVAILTALNTALEQSLAGAFVAFKGLSVAEVNAMRAELKKEGVVYTVVKKTLLKKALAQKGIAGDMPEMPAETAFAYLKDGADITAPARALQAFVKKYKEKLAFLGGYIEGAFVSLDEIKSVATIPPADVLRGMFVNIINSPRARFAIALGEVAKTK